MNTDTTGRLPYASDRPKTKVRVDPGIRKKSLGRLHGLVVYLVDGLIVRNNVDIDFTSGGTSARYFYIPVRDVWIDECLGTTDRAATILHEYVERTKMIEDKLSYDAAHDIANSVESVFRAEIENDVEFKELQHKLNLRLVTQAIDQYRAKGLW